MSYNPMPPAPPPGYQPQQPKGPAPSTVINAVRLMFASVVLSVIGLVVAFTTKDQLRKAIRDSDSGLTTKQVNDAVNIGLGVGAVIAIVLIVLYVLLALQVRKGKQWARVVTWILAGIGVLGSVSNLARPDTGLGRILAVIQLAVYIGIIVFLMLRPSTDYFRKRTY
jgi:phosphatidylserine synthase